MSESERCVQEGVLGGEWSEALLLRLSLQLLQHRQLLSGAALPSKSMQRCVVAAVRHALQSPNLRISELRAAAARVRRLYYAQCEDLQRAHGESGWLAHAPPWVRALEPAMRDEPPPPAASEPEPEPPSRPQLDAGERLLALLVDQARALRCVNAATVCGAAAGAAGVPASALTELWTRLVESVRAKLAALVAGGDAQEGLTGAARLSTTEWRLVDALLLHGGVSVLRPEHVQRAEPLHALVACFHLVQLFRLEEGGAPDAWRAAAASFRRRHRAASAVLLQRRWYELKAMARRELAAGARGADVEPLLAAVARRFPHVITAPLEPWRVLVVGGLVLEACDLTQPALEAAASEKCARPRGSPPRAPDAEDDLILVEQEIETVDLLEEAQLDDVRAALESRRRRMAAALQDELERQLHDLAPPAKRERRSTEDVEGAREADTSEDVKPDLRADRDDELEEAGIDHKLLLQAVVPLVRVDDPAWRPDTPARRPDAPARRPDAPAWRPDASAPALHSIRIVSIKSELKEEHESDSGSEDEARRKPVRLPNIAEVRRSHRRMLTAQVAPLAASHDSDDEGALCIDSDSASGESSSGGVLSAAQLSRVLGSIERAPRLRDVSWRTRYCCAARYHRALNDARARTRLKGARVAPAPVSLHDARCAPPCQCCCARLLEGAEDPLAAQHESLLRSARALVGVLPPDEGALPPDEGALPPAETTRAPPARRLSRKRRLSARRRAALASPQPAADPLAEWNRQRNINSQYFDLNLKKPPAAPRLPPPAAAPAPVFTKKKIITVSTAREETPPPVPPSPPPVSPAPGGERAAQAAPPQRMRRALWPKEPAPVPAGGTKAVLGDTPGTVLPWTGGTLPPGAIPVTCVVAEGVMKLVPLQGPAPEPVVDLCADSPPPAESGASALLRRLPAGIVVRRRSKGVARADAARSLLKRLPADTVVRSQRAPLLLNSTRAPAAPLLLNSPRAPAAPLLLNSTRAPAAPLLLNSPRAPAAPLLLNSTRAPAAPLLLNSTRAPAAPLLLNSTRAPAAPLLLNSTRAPAAPPLNSTRAPAAPLLLNSTRAPAASLLLNSTRAPAAPLLLNSTRAPAAPLLLNRMRAPATPLLLNSTRAPAAPPADVKVFKISLDGRLFPASKEPPVEGGSGGPAQKPPESKPLALKPLSLKPLSLKLPAMAPLAPRPAAVQVRLLPAPADAPTPQKAAVTKVGDLIASDGRRVVFVRRLGAGKFKMEIAGVTGAPAVRSACLTRGLAGVTRGPADLTGGPTGLTRGPADLTGDPGHFAEKHAASSAESPVTPVDELAETSGLDALCTFELAGAEETAEEEEEGEAVHLRGGAVVKPVQPSYDFPSGAVEVGALLAGAPPPLLVVWDRDAPPYTVRGRYYVRTARPLRVARAALLTEGGPNAARRVLLRAPPALEVAGAGAALRLLGHRVRLHWVCRSAREVRALAAGGAALWAVSWVSGEARPLTCARAPRPSDLALRCNFLDAAREITRDVNMVPYSSMCVRIAPRPPAGPRHAPAPAALGTLPVRSRKALLKPKPPPALAGSPQGAGGAAAALPRIIKLAKLNKPRVSLLIKVDQTSKQRPEEAIEIPAATNVQALTEGDRGADPAGGCEAAPTQRTEAPAPAARRAGRAAASAARARLAHMLAPQESGAESGGDAALDWSDVAGLDVDSDDDYRPPTAGAGGQGPGAGEHWPGAGEHWPGAGEQGPGAGEHWPGAGEQGPGAGDAMEEDTPLAGALLVGAPPAATS